MLGGGPIGTMPVGMAEDDIRWAAVGSAIISATFEFTIYVATEEFATEPGDNPASEPYEGTLQEIRNFKRSILGGSQIGEFAIGDGQLIISNVAGNRDDLIKQYSIAGQPVLVRVGRPGIDLVGTEFYTLFNGRASGWSVDQERFIVYLRDNGYRLDVPAQPNLYAGTGDAEGGDDLAGKPKPRALGYCLNVSPPMVIPNYRVFQVNDGIVNAITAVYDRAVLLAQGDDYSTLDGLIAADTIAGTYDTCLAEGYFKISDLNGTITADVQGVKADGVFISATTDIIQYMITSTTDVSYPSEFDVASFTALKTTQPAPVGKWLGPDDTMTVRDVCAALMGGIGSWVGFLRSGKVYVKRFEAPSGTPVASFDDTDMVGNPTSSIIRERLPTGASPAWRQRVMWKPNGTVQTDLAGSVDDDRRAFVAAAYRVAEASDIDVIIDYPDARDPDVIEAYFYNQSDALAEATRQFELSSVDRALYRMRLPRSALVLEIGSVIEVTFDRFDLEGGKLLIVVEITEDISPNQFDSVEVVAYG